MKSITLAELVALFLNPEISGINGASFIGIDSLTEVKLSGGKANPMQGLVQKVTEGSSVMVFQNKNSNGYENMVRRRLESEGKEVNFSVSPRVWGERIQGCPLVAHKGEYYLEVIFLKAGKTSYLFNGSPIEKANIQGMPENPEGGEQGGLENKVIIRTYKIASLTRITINKETYIIKGQ